MQDIQDAKFYLRKRYLVAALFSFGLILRNVAKEGLSNLLADITYHKYIVVGNTTILQVIFYYFFLCRVIGKKKIDRQFFK